MSVTSILKMTNFPKTFTIYHSLHLQMHVTLFEEFV